MALNNVCTVLPFSIAVMLDYCFFDRFSADV